MATLPPASAAAPPTTAASPAVEELHATTGVIIEPSLVTEAAAEAMAAASGSPGVGAAGTAPPLAAQSSLGARLSALWVGCLACLSPTAQHQQQAVQKQEQPHKSSTNVVQEAGQAVTHALEAAKAAATSAVTTFTHEMQKHSQAAPGAGVGAPPGAISASGAAELPAASAVGSPAAAATVPDPAAATGRAPVGGGALGAALGTATTTPA